VPDPIQMNQVGGKKLREQVDQTGDVVIKSKDANPPQNPQIVRAFCFDHITDPSTHVRPQPPPPQPNPPPRRDPFLLELGNIELGSKIQLISLSDNPAANFDKGEVFELQFTGYDANTRRGTVLLSAEEMAKKAIEPGERLVIRILDDNGNHSDGVFVHVDPTRWAGNQQLNTKNEAGQNITVQGAPVTFTDGFVAPGANVANFTKSTFGATLTDTSGPKLNSEGVVVKSFEWSKTEQEMFQSLGQTGYFNNTTVEAGVAWCKSEANMAGIPIEHRATVAAMAANDGALLKKMLESQNPTFTPAELAKTPVTQQMFQAMAQTAQAAITNGKGRETMVVFKEALEPGVRVAVQNNSTGQALNGAQNDTQRSNVVRIHLNEGDKVHVQLTDGNGVAGAPYAFEFDSSSKNGKRAEKGGSFKNPLNMQLAARTVKLNGE
jgi:hypothetical protein